MQFTQHDPKGQRSAMKPLRPLCATLIATVFTGTCLLMFATGLPCAAQAVPSVRDTRTTSLLLLYRCRPESRPAFRTYLHQVALPRLRHMQQKGALAHATILFSRYVDTEKWDALIFLHFPSPQAAPAWSSTEVATPAALDAQGLRLVTAISTYPLDLMQTGEAATPASHPVFLVIPYDYTVSTDESFGRRAAVVDVVCAKLRNNPEWKAISDRKQSVRVERASIVADEIR